MRSIDIMRLVASANLVNKWVAECMEGALNESCPYEAYQSASDIMYLLGKGHLLLSGFWMGLSLRENCAYALAEFNKAYPNGYDATELETKENK